MLEKHSGFYFSQPVIYFGFHEFFEDDPFQECDGYIPLQFSLTYPLSSPETELKTGMHIDWSDVQLAP
jgi:hypothetical protein